MLFSGINKCPYEVWSFSKKWPYIPWCACVWIQLWPYIPWCECVWIQLSVYYLNIPLKPGNDFGVYVQNIENTLTQTLLLQFEIKIFET